MNVLDQIAGGKIAVQCATEELANEFLKELEECGIRWVSGRKPTEMTHWERFKEKTCYTLHYRTGERALNCEKVSVFKELKFLIVDYPFLLPIGGDNDESD